MAPLRTGQGAPAELQRAFQAELPSALVAAGFPLVPPNEVDMRIGERPELLRCDGGPCLAEQAAFLGVGRMLLSRLERDHDHPGEPDFTVSLTIYDAAQKREIAGAVEPCVACSTDGVRAAVRAAVERLRQKVVVLDQPPVVEAPPPVAPPIAAHPRTRFRLAKWVLLGVGAAAAGVGGGLWGIDGHGTCAQAGRQECPQVYDTIGVGATLVALGGAAAVTAVLMFALDRPVEPKVGKVSFLPVLTGSGEGAGVGVAGRF